MLVQNRNYRRVFGPVISALFATAITAAAVGCAHELGTQRDSGRQDTQDALINPDAVIVSRADDMTHVLVEQGQYLVVRLPVSQGAGYRWQVISNLRHEGDDIIEDALVFIDESYIPALGADSGEDAIDEDAIYEAVFSTSANYLATGEHSLVLEHRRGEAIASEWFHLDVTVFEKGQLERPEPTTVVIDVDEDGAAVEVRQGTVVTVRLPVGEWTRWVFEDTSNPALVLRDSTRITDEHGRSLQEVSFSTGFRLATVGDHTISFELTEGFGEPALEALEVSIWVHE